MENVSQKQVLRGRLILVILAVLFMLPVIAAYGLYFGGWQPVRTTNHGELLMPVLPIGDIELRTLQGDSLLFSDLRRRWALIYVEDAGDCQQACRHNLYVMRQIHVAQGKYQKRVQRVLITAQADDPSVLTHLAAAYPDMLIAMGSKTGVSALIKQFRGDKQQSPDDRSGIYIVDPIGNLVMRFKAQSDPAGMRKDLERLLRSSQIG